MFIPDRLTFGIVISGCPSLPSDGLYDQRPVLDETRAGAIVHLDRPGRQGPPHREHNPAVS